MNDSELAREKIVQYLHETLIGPIGGKDEIINGSPLLRYMMGGIFPKNSSIQKLEMDDAEGNDTDESSSESKDDSKGDAENPISMAFERLPSSLGITFYLEGSGVFSCEIWGAAYEPVNPEGKKSKIRQSDHKRISIAEWNKPEKIKISKEQSIYPVLNDRAYLHIHRRKKQKDGQIITVTLVNSYEGESSRNDVENAIFQCGIRIIAEDSEIKPYPSKDTYFEDIEDQVFDLQYSNKPVYGIGHGVSVDWKKEGDKVTSVETTYLPSCEVYQPSYDLVDENGKPLLKDDSFLKIYSLSEDNLDFKKLEKNLNQLLGFFTTWISSLEKKSTHESHKDAQKYLIEKLAYSQKRIQKGIDILCHEDSKTIQKAFILANRAMLHQMVHAGRMTPEPYPLGQGKINTPNYAADSSNIKWRPFQIAYFLLVLESLINEKSGDRDVVDLLWFPTGGGKTEAYLFLSAFEIFHRRILHGDKGAGTAVINRYTLRLLSTQQFERTALLVAAMELIRRENKKQELGSHPFTVGLWAGEGVSPNTFKKAHEIYQETVLSSKPENPFILQKCPYCGTEIVPKKHTLDEEGEIDLQKIGIKCDENSFTIACPESRCPFHEEIPVSIVDQKLYRYPPSMLLGTVDKFAMLAWKDEATAFFGGVNDNFYPPSLLIQDEMHLISGPLGTIDGLYEAAIDVILSKKGIRPKIIAATATIRHAHEQVKGLYAREVLVFPAGGLSAEDSFFSRIDRKKPARLYLGIMGQGYTKPAVALQWVVAALTQSVIDLKLTGKPLDAYWTQVVYHNSKRELGRTSTACHDEIPSRIKVIARDNSNIRKIYAQELSSNMEISIGEALKLLSITKSDISNAVDIVPCTNIFSVGVDVNRLGLMVINGQPKTTSEYIQASSRVGRKDDAPGLVIAVYSSGKPRDRSHYESFKHYHQTLYKQVEPTSVTPYALPARERALPGALITAVRHSTRLGNNMSAGDFDLNDNEIKITLESLTERMRKADSEEAENIDNLIKELSTYWESYASEEDDLRYENWGSGQQFRALMRPFDSAKGGPWKVMQNMRHVDAEVTLNIWGQDDSG